jgi:hypothetical protein
LFEAEASLGEVCLDAESDPRRCVSLRLVAASLDFLEDAVVVGGVLAQVFLDGGELWAEQPFAGEDE